MKAFLFPGQGAQTVQMSAEIVAAYPAAAAIYEEAHRITGVDLTALTEDQLSQTRFSQLAIIVHSIASLEAYRSGMENPSEPVCLAGFSLGEYTALYAAGVIGFTDLLLLVNERARLMQIAAEKNPGAMVAVLGLSDEQVEACLAGIDDVYPVNYNCNGQLVCAGTVCAVEKASAELLTLGARRAMRLAVNGAFHSPFMSEAAAGLRAFAVNMTFAPLTVPLYSNATGEAVPFDVDIPSYLENHMVSPVRFTDEIRRMRLDGYDEFIELGPGKVLTGLLKKI